MKMKKHYVILGAALSMLLMPSCSGDSTPDDPNIIPPLPNLELTVVEKTNNTGLNQFGFELLNATDAKCEEIYGQDYDGNVVVSPLSATIALAMLANAGSEDVTDKTVKMLHCNNLSDLNSVCNKLIRHLASEKNIELANSAWYDRTSFSVNSSFIKDMADIFYSDVNAAEFGTDKAADLINAWCSGRTHGKIDKLLKQTRKEDVCYLINVMYFKDRWASEFDPADTGAGTFNGRPVREMMHGDYIGSYFESDICSGIEMPFRNGTSMYVLLPDEDNGVTAGDLARTISVEQWNVNVAAAKKCQIHLSLPKFEINNGCQLEKALHEMGFPMIASSLEKMGTLKSGRPIELSVIQKTSTTINEEGAEVAAVTAVQGVDTAWQPEQITGEVTFTVDRPFVFIIMNKSTGTMLMAGRITSI